MNDEDDVSGYVANLLMGNDDVPAEAQQLHSMSIRIPYELASYLIVMAETGDRSRNEMARLLLQAGVDSVLTRLHPQISDDIREAAMERFQTMISES